MMDLLVVLVVVVDVLWKEWHNLVQSMHNKSESGLELDCESLIHQLKLFSHLVGDCLPLLFHLVL